MTIRIRDIGEEDRERVGQILRERWGEARIVSRGQLFDAERLPGLVAEIGEEIVGLLTWHCEADEETCEIVTVDALLSGKGIGRELIKALVERGRDEGWRRLLLITTNDNRPAQSFYQRLGFRLSAIHAGAVEEARRIKPTIPLIGHAGTPITDELEYELTL